MSRAGRQNGTLSRLACEDEPKKAAIFLLRELGFHFSNSPRCAAGNDPVSVLNGQWRDILCIESDGCSRSPQPRTEMLTLEAKRTRQPGMQRPAAGPEPE